MSFLRRIYERIKNEPVLVLNAVGALLDAVVVFGLNLDPGLETGIMGVITAVVNLIARRQVTPVRTLPA